MTNDNCIFCKIANGEIPSYTVYEDERFRAILDAAPANEGHTLILPKEHYDNLFALPKEIAEEVLLLAQRIGMQLTEKLQCDGINVMQNNGEAAGQTVMHYHLHLIPRFKQDGLFLPWTPQKPTPEEQESVLRRITE